VGFSPQPSEAERLIIGYQYALLRRTIPELSGTAVAGERTTLLLWFAVLFVGVAVGLVGLVMATAGKWARHWGDPRIHIAVQMT